MKKTILILMALTLILSLAACGSSPSAEAGTSGQTENTAKEAQEPAAAAAEQKPAEASADTKPAEAAAQTAEPPKESPAEPPAPEEPSGEVVLDNDYFKLTFNGVEEDDEPFLCRLLLDVECKKPEDELLFSYELFGMAVNGYGITENSYEFDEQPAENGCIKLGIRVYNAVLEAIGVDSIDKIEKVDVVLSGWEYPDGKYAYKNYGECSIYPTGLEGSYVQKPREAMVGDETVETENFRLTLFWKEGVDFISAHESSGLHSPVVIIENRTNEEYHFSADNFKINGVQNELRINSGYVGGNIKPGGTLVGMLDADGTVRAAKEKNITKADQISFDFNVHAVSNDPNSLGDTLAVIPVKVAPEDIHK